MRPGAARLKPRDRARPGGIGRIASLLLPSVHVVHVRRRSWRESGLGTLESLVRTLDTVGLKPCERK